MIFRPKKRSGNASGKSRPGQQTAPNPLARRFRAGDEPPTIDLAGSEARFDRDGKSGDTRVRAGADMPGSGARPADPVVGFLVVVAGPGRGSFASLHEGMNPVGRMPSQRVCLDHGDRMIARENHCQVVYDGEARRFFVQQGASGNETSVRGRPVLAPVELSPGEELEVGRTVLRLVAVCGDDFDWRDETERSDAGPDRKNPC